MGLTVCIQSGYHRVLIWKVGYHLDTQPFAYPAAAVLKVSMCVCVCV